MSDEVLRYGKLGATIFLILALSFRGSAQNMTPKVNTSQDREVWTSHVNSSQLPLSTDQEDKSLAQLEFRMPEDMSLEDKTLVNSAKATISERARRQGFDLDGARPKLNSWQYEEVVCPAFPDHLILEYSQDGGEGAVSMFSVIVPRQDLSRVKVIPIRRKGYGLWTSAPANRLSLNDFNDMAEQRSTGFDSEWLTVGLCYAALTGARLGAPISGTNTSRNYQTESRISTSTIVSHTGTEVYFNKVMSWDSKSAWHSVTWVMEFSPKGRLRKVKEVQSKEFVERILPSRPR